HAVEGAIRHEVQRLRSEGQVAATFQCSGEELALPVNSQTCLLRVVQEALTNVRKHARATRVEVGLAWEPDSVTLTVKDNGRGFDPGAPREEGRMGGFGLISMRQRCELAGGALSVRSQAGEGTEIRATLEVAPHG